MTAMSRPGINHRESLLLPELSNLQWLAYGIGGIGIVLEWRAYLLRCGQAFRRWSAAGALLWALQYWLLDAWTAGLTMASTALRTLLSGPLEQNAYRHGAAAVCVFIFFGLILISWQGHVSLWPAFAVINTTLALFYLDNRRMRMALLASSVAWVANDLYWHAWPALFAETTAMAINLHTLRRLFLINSGK
jgi:hypothetical protein